MSKILKVKTWENPDPDFLWMLLGTSTQEYTRRNLKVILMSKERIDCVDGYLFDGVPYIGHIPMTVKSGVGIEMRVGTVKTSELIVAKRRSGTS